MDDSTVPEDFTIAMEPSKCVIDFSQCLLRDDILLHHVAEFKKGSKCTQHVFWLVF